MGAIVLIAVGVGAAGRCSITEAIDQPDGSTGDGGQQQDEAWEEYAPHDRGSEREALLFRAWLPFAGSQRLGGELARFDLGGMLELYRGSAHLLHKVHGSGLLLIILEIGECGACEQGQGYGGDQDDEAVHGMGSRIRILCERNCSSRARNLNQLNPFKSSA